MLSWQYSTCCKVLPTSYNNGYLTSTGLFRKNTPLIVPFPIHEKINRDKILNTPEEAGQVLDTQDKLINNSPKKPISLPETDKKVEISTKSQKRKSKDDTITDFSPTKIPKASNLSKYRLDIKN